MNIIINAVLPIICLLILGNILRRTGFISQEFWASADKITYYVLFPALLMTKVSQVDLGTIAFDVISIFILSYFTILSIISYAIYHYFGTHRNQFSSIYQGIMRFNSYIFFALTESIWGHDALITAALFAGITIPIVNVFCVASFSVGSGQFSFTRLINPIIKNPLILGTAGGFILNHYPLLLPSALFDSMNILAQAALPLALLSVGAAVRIKTLYPNHTSFSMTSLWLSTITGLLISPIVALVLADLLGISGHLHDILILFAAVPTATSSYILSKQLDGNSEMMATIISLQTVLSLATLTGVLVILS